MSTFKKYLLEKVEKREINKALKDDNIYIGVEFEILMDDPVMDNNASGSLESIFNIDALSREFHRLIHSARNNVENYFNSLDNYIKDYLRDSIYPDVKEEINKKISEFEEKITELEKIKKDWATTNQDEIEDDIEENRAEIKSLEDEKEVIEDALNDGDWEEAKDNMEVYYGDIDDRYEYAEEYSDFNFPTCSGELDLFYENVGVIGTFDSTLKEGMQNALSSENLYDIEETLTLEGFYDPEYINDNQEYDDDDDDDIRNLDLWDDAPFDINQADVGDYHASSNYNNWRVEKDQTIDNNSSYGVEIISPIMPIKEGMKIIPEMFGFISKYGKTVKPTGFHVNLSYKGKNLWRDADLRKVILFMDEGYIWKHFKDRENNTWTRSVKNFITNQVIGSYNTDIEKIKKESGNNKKFFEKFISTIKLPVEHSFGINLTHADKKSGRVEFRYLGGKGYHKKWDKIHDQIGRYAHYILIALDPTYQYKEYVLKLERLISLLPNNKINAVGKGKIYNREIATILKKGQLINTHNRKSDYSLNNMVYTVDLERNVIDSAVKLNNYNKSIQKRLKNRDYSRGTREMNKFILTKGKKIRGENKKNISVYEYKKHIYFYSETKNMIMTKITSKEYYKKHKRITNIINQM